MMHAWVVHWCMHRCMHGRMHGCMREWVDVFLCAFWHAWKRKAVGTQKCTQIKCAHRHTQLCPCPMPPYTSRRTRSCMHHPYMCPCTQGHGCLYGGVGEQSYHLFTSVNIALIYTWNSSISITKIYFWRICHIWPEKFQIFVKMKKKCLHFFDSC